MFRSREILRWSRWAVSEEGRMQLGYGIVGLTISSTIAVFLKETYASDKWIRWRKLLINPETQEDIMAANSLLDIFTEEYNQSSLVSASSLTLLNFIPPKLFVTRDLQTYSSGKNGAYMGYNFGLPVNFNFTSVQEILDSRKLFSGILERKYGIARGKINQEDYQQLANNLYLSDMAKRFAIQFELQKQRAMSTPLIEATSFLLYGSTIYFLSLTTNNLFNLLRKPLYLRLTSYAGFFAVCTLSFLQLRDDIYGWRGRKGLRATLDLDDSYLEGAKEYIKKRLAINRTIAKLLGIKRGDKEFTIAGDEKRTLMGFRDLALMKQLELVDAWESLKEPPPPQRSN